MVRTQFALFFPGWNIKLRKILEDFTERLKKYEYFGDVYSEYPDARSYHSASLEYFPRVRRGLTKEEGLFIAKELVKYLKENYLPHQRRGSILI
jgi:hypothetical protein